MKYIREVLQHIEVEATEVGDSGIHHRVQTVPWGLLHVKTQNL